MRAQEHAGGLHVSGATSSLRGWSTEPEHKMGAEEEARCWCKKCVEEGGRWGVTPGPVLMPVKDSEHWSDQQS